ncbi:MAG: hypothetical protein Q4P11_03420 [Methanobrevibacter sp.]|nr:hypothetical protein [Methanobrevibacter sp.]
MSNSKNSNLEDVSNGNDESSSGKADSTSNKKTRFTKSKSISEVFKELEFDEEDENIEFSDDFDDDSVDEIIPIHNEYKDLDKSEAFDEDSIEGGVIINPDLDDSDEADVKESIEYEIDSIENTDSIDGETDSDEFSESLSVKTDFDESGESIDAEDIDDEDFITGKNGDVVLADENIEGKIGKSSAQGVLINDKDKTSDSGNSLDIFNSSTIISVAGFIVGLAILIIGISYYASSSDRVVDNVLSGETAGLAIFLVIIGFIIIAFSLLKFFSSSKSSLIIDTFNSIKSIDYDEVSEDVISREDFDAVFSIFKRKKDSNFSDNDKSVDSSKDLFEKDQEDELSDDDISSLYSKSNLTSQKNQSSSKGHENANSTETSQDYDDGVDEIIPIHSRLNEQSDEESLEDKYSKYDFDDGMDDEYALSDENDGEYDLVEDDRGIAEENLEEDIIDEEYEIPEQTQLEDDADSDLEVEKMDGLEEKYSKYDFDDDFDDEVDEPAVSKPKFKRSVDISKFENVPLTEEELAEKERKARELEEKKRRIIEGTNFDNSLRKH